MNRYQCKLRYKNGVEVLTTWVPCHLGPLENVCSPLQKYLVPSKSKIRFPYRLLSSKANSTSLRSWISLSVGCLHWAAGTQGQSSRVTRYRDTVVLVSTGSTWIVRPRNHSLLNRWQFAAHMQHCYLHRWGHSQLVFPRINSWPRPNYWRIQRMGISLSQSNSKNKLI